MQNLATVVYFEPDDVDDCLARLGLSRETFVTAAKEGLAAFSACTPNHPATFPGTSQWAETNRSMRDGLVFSKWTRVNEMNQPLVINATKTMAITAVSGDANTGVKDAFPSTRSSKGPRTADAIRANQGRFEFMDDPAPVVASMKVSGRSTWLFLFYRDMQRSELRYELSKPTSMTEDGHVSDWAERIIFPPTSFDENVPNIGEDDGGQSPEIVVEIRKRG
jgi:hypothetical protein